MSHMVRMGLRPASLALAAALCFGTHVQAADGPIVAQSTLTLSGLSFQLIDLTPGDGIAPSLSFQTQGIVDSANSAYDEANDTWVHSGPTYSNSLLPSTPLNYVSPDGLSTVTSTANSVTLESQLPLSQILPPPDGAGMGDTLYNWTSTGTDLAVGNAYPGEFQSFTLSAGSALVVRGTLSGSLVLDGSTLDAQLGTQGYTDWSLNHSGEPVATFIMAAQVDGIGDGLSGFSGLIGSQVNGISASLVTSDFSYLSSGSDTRTVQTASSRDFEFTLTNLGQADMNGLLALNLNVFSSMSLTALRPDVPPPIDLPPIDVPAIPEPSTYALMGLGLVGIATVARRRRHTA